MTQEDVKKFGKGIKTYGKNFVKISSEYLPMYSRVSPISIGRSLRIEIVEGCSKKALTLLSRAGEMSISARATWGVFRRVKVCSSGVSRVPFEWPPARACLPGCAINARSGAFRHANKQMFPVAGHLLEIVSWN